MRGAWAWLAHALQCFCDWRAFFSTLSTVRKSVTPQRTKITIIKHTYVFYTTLTRSCKHERSNVMFFNIIVRNNALVPTKQTFDPSVWCIRFISCYHSQNIALCTKSKKKTRVSMQCNQRVVNKQHTTPTFHRQFI